MRQVRKGHVQICLVVPLDCAAATSRGRRPHISFKTLLTVLDFFCENILKCGMGTLQGDGGGSNMKKKTLILLCRQHLAAGILQFVDILIDLFLGALFCRFIAPISFQKGSISCKSRIWYLGYTQGNVDYNKLNPVHMREILYVVSSDRIKAAPETLSDTTIGMLPHFFVLSNCFTQGWEDIFLGV